MKWLLARDTTGNQQHKQLPFNLIAEALQNRGHQQVDRRADWAVILGWYSPHQSHKPFHQRRLKIITEYPGRVICIDSDPLGRTNEYWRLRLGAWGYLGSRSLALPKTPRPLGDDVLIALPSRSGWNWPEAFEAQMRTLAERYPQALVRIKPGTKLRHAWPQGWPLSVGSLEEDFQQAHTIVAWTPSMATKALQWGRDVAWQNTREPMPTLETWSHGVYSREEIREGLWLNYVPC